MKKAFITGITGQDGSYLAELLLSQDYEVHGLIRRASTFNTGRIEHIYKDPHNGGRLFLHYGDVTDTGSLIELIHGLQPDEIYHLAAQSHVRVSFELAEYTGDVTGLGVIRILEAIRKSGVKTRFYQASSSEMFGAAKPPQNELTPFEPQSPYAVAKVYAYWMTRTYRQGYQMYAANGILFNHESPRRGETFVTRKITHALAAIKAGKQSELFLGNLDARRDWGYAPDYVAAMWKMLQCDQAGDYVIGTGEAAFGPRVPGRSLWLPGHGLAPVRQDRPALLPPQRGRFPAVRPLQSPPRVQLGAACLLQGPGAHHGGCRPGVDRSPEPRSRRRDHRKAPRRLAPLGQPGCEHGVSS